MMYIVQNSTNSIQKGSEMRTSKVESMFTKYPALIGVLVVGAFVSPSVVEVVLKFFNM